MLLAGRILKDFPIFKQYAYHNFQAVLESTTIVKNMETYGSLNKSALRAVMTTEKSAICEIASPAASAASLRCEEDKA